MPGKYGPHGELFFLLIQKERETFSPFINSDIDILLLDEQFFGT